MSRIDARRSSTNAPAQFSIRAMNAKLCLVGRRVFIDVRQRRSQPLPILRMNERANIVQRHRETVRIDTENAVLPFVPRKVAAGGIPVPRPHLARGQR
jgi:hypothetical protein